MTFGNKISFTSLGCPRNLVDSEVMLGLLLQAGYEVTEFLDEADYLVVNTCAFLESARQESTETIAELMEVKKPEAKLIVTGCMVSKHRGEIERLFPGVHYLLGSGDAEGILKAVQSDEPGTQIRSTRSYLEEGEVPRQLSTPSHYAYLKIAEGCRKGCAYCSIPKIKGPLRSKSEAQIVKEFRALRAKGVQEIILIAQDLGDYGKDSNTSLASLLRTLLKESGDFWLRLLYLYPDEITDEIIDLFQSDPRICPYLDMPIQHINDTLLKAMRRHTTGSQIKETITRLRTVLPDIHIRTSLIVGFPGETDAQFDELCTFVQEYPLNHVGIFTYSREPGTPADRLPGHLPESIKETRRDHLAALQQETLATLHAPLIGRRLPVVVEGYHPETDLLMVGRYFGQCPDIDGHVILNDTSPITSFGTRYLVEITGTAGYDLVGLPLHPLNPKSKLKLA